MADSVILIPTYNERENVARIIEAIFALPQSFDVLIIDDNSPDNTAEIVQLLQLKYPDRLYLEQRKGKLGLGTAYIHGFQWALARSYQFIFEMDADFSHNPADLHKLYDACANNSADVAVGSRYVIGGNVKNWTWERIILSYGASWYVRLITGMPVRDSTAGFICYKRVVLETLNLQDINVTGYAFQIEMKYKAWKKGFYIAEIPITFIDRVLGESKMSIKIFNEALKSVFALRFKK